MVRAFRPAPQSATKSAGRSVDNACIDTTRLILPGSSIARSSLRHQLWVLAGGVALFLATVLAAQAARSIGHRSQTSPGFGLDFIAFYTGGAFVNDGRGRDLYDLRAVRQFQHELGTRNGVDLGDALGPWWNPPFYAWVFSPLARLPFPVATGVWIALNIACAAVASWLLVRMLPRRDDWRTWALVPVGIGLSVPFLQSLTHGQNSGTSLLLLVATVTAWRGGRGFAAGLVGGLLFYKPQLGAVVAAAMVLSLGWRALGGLAVTGSILLAVTLLTLPGSLGDFLHRMPQNIEFVQIKCVYMWERHATLKAFWRLLLQGRAIGGMRLPAVTATAVSVAAVAVMLVRTSPLMRWIDPFGARADEHGLQQGASRHDGFIAATIAATPLLMPFYFDYDLLLLAVPAVLFAADVMRRGPARTRPTDRWLTGAWCAFYAWMLINADFGEVTRLNLAVPLLAAVASLLAWRAMPRQAVVRVEETPAPVIARAA